ncbi:hypothetical protein PO902_15445 [Planococcus maritimus]|nr:hypothetical protein [Planococcus sp. SK3692]MDE4086443.1 hypothetical protein [Planococcus maritimus]
MFEVANEFFSKFGIPGILVALVMYFMRNNPITSISASAIEMKLATKEKRLYVRVVKYVGEILGYTTILLILTITFFSNKNLFHPVVAFALAIILLGVYLWIVVLDASEKSFSDLVNGLNIKWKWIVYVLFILHFISSFIFISYYIGTQIYSSFFDKSFTDTERSTILIGVIILYFFIAIMMQVTVLDTYYRFIGFKNPNKHSLSINIEEEKWYLLHPVDKEVYLLGDTPVIQECTQFCFLERHELLKETIKVEQ